jgi:hypothetical protein
MVCTGKLCVFCPSELAAILPVGKRFGFHLAQRWVGSRNILDVVCARDQTHLYRSADKSLARPRRIQLTGHLQHRRHWPTWASYVLITDPIFWIRTCWATTCSLGWKNTWKGSRSGLWLINTPVQPTASRFIENKKLTVNKKWVK